MLFHAAHAVKQAYASIIITSEDTDVFLLCLAFSDQIAAPIYMKCGTKNRVRFNDIQKLRDAIGHEVCAALPGMHAYTGCDTVSAFAGRGKSKALKIITAEQRYRHLL